MSQPVPEARKGFVTPSNTLPSHLFNQMPGAVDAPTPKFPCRSRIVLAVKSAVLPALPPQKKSVGLPDPIKCANVLKDVPAFATVLVVTKLKPIPVQLSAAMSLHQDFSTVSAVMQFAAELFPSIVRCSRR